MVIKNEKILLHISLYKININSMLISCKYFKKPKNIKKWMTNFNLNLSKKSSDSNVSFLIRCNE